MAINSERVSKRVVSSLRSIGIDDKVGTEDSHTVKLINIIVDAILDEIVNNGEVIIKNLPVQTPMGPGSANGKADIR